MAWENIEKILFERIQCFPGNKGWFDSISAKIHPTLQISIDLVYPLELSIISGARYHLVATYSVKMPVWSCCGSATLAKPKSQICDDEWNMISLITLIGKESMTSKMVAVQVMMMMIDNDDFHNDNDDYIVQNYASTRSMD